MRDLWTRGAAGVGVWTLALLGAAGPAGGGPTAVPDIATVGSRGDVVVRCESIRLRQVACPAASDANVRVARVLGGRCIPGITWFYDKRAIHVRGDCRALFIVGGAPQTVGQPRVR